MYNVYTIYVGILNKSKKQKQILNNYIRVTFYVNCRVIRYILDYHIPRYLAGCVPYQGKISRPLTVSPTFTSAGAAKMTICIEG